MKARQKIIRTFILAAAAFWIVHALLDVFVFKIHTGPLPQQLLVSLISPVHDLYIRLIILAVLAVTCVLILNLTRSRELAKEALKESEARFRELFDNMSSGVAIYEAVDDGEDFIIRDFNRAAQRIENVSKEDVTGVSVLKAFPGVREFGLFDVFRRVWKTGQPKHFPIGLYKDDRIQGWRENYVLKLPSGEIAAIYEDATERKIAEEALRESEEKYRAIFNNAQVGLFRTRLSDGMILEANERIAQMFGYASRDQMIGDFIAEERYTDPGTREAMLAELKSTGEVKNFDARFTRQDGSIIWVRYTARLYLDKGYLEGIAADITEQKRAQHEVLKYQNHLEELVEARTRELKETQDKLIASERLAVLGQFSGNVSHEIRNPLGVIGSSVYYLKRRLDTEDKKITSHLDKIQNQVDICTGIIESILKLTRMESPDFQLLDLTLHLHVIIDSCKPPEGIKLELDLPDSPVWIQGDGGQLEIVFTNIIQNAVQAIDKEGSVSVSLSRITTADGGRAEIKFKDTGSGIPREELENVFQPLFTTRATGIGFGLSIAKMVIERHNGDISAKSDPEQGATFTVTLPLAEEPERKVDQT